MNNPKHNARVKRLQLQLRRLGQAHLHHRRERRRDHQSRPRWHDQPAQVPGILL